MIRSVLGRDDINFHLVRQMSLAEFGPSRPVVDTRTVGFKKNVAQTNEVRLVCVLQAMQVSVWTYLRWSEGLRLFVLLHFYTVSAILAHFVVRCCSTCPRIANRELSTLLVVIPMTRMRSNQTAHRDQESAASKGSWVFRLTGFYFSTQQ